MSDSFMAAHGFTQHWEEIFSCQTSFHSHDFSRQWLQDLLLPCAQAQEGNKQQHKDFTSILSIADFPSETIAHCMRKNFWKPLRCADLPLALACILYDSAVHMGVSHAVKMIQECCNIVGEAHLDTYHAVSEDGIMGKKTIALARNLAEHGLDFYTARMAVRQRVYHYGKWAQKNPSLAEHIPTWKARCQALLEHLALLEREAD